MARLIIEEERSTSPGDTEQCWLAGFCDDIEGSDLVSVFNNNEVRTDDYD